MEVEKCKMKILADMMSVEGLILEILGGSYKLTLHIIDRTRHSLGYLMI